jgi:hypothetical protein
LKKHYFLSFPYGDDYFYYKEKSMLFLLPVAAAITIGEAIGIGTTVFGIGVGVRGALDYRKAKMLKAEAEEEYRKMTMRVKKKPSH